jgi:hypothetical protein
MNTDFVKYKNLHLDDFKVMMENIENAKNETAKQQQNSYSKGRICGSCIGNGRVN